MAYSVVEFDTEEVCYLPTEWIIEENQCYWPIQKSKLNMYREECFPPKSDWTVCNLRRVFCSGRKLQH